MRLIAVVVVFVGFKIIAVGQFVGVFQVKLDRIEPDDDQARVAFLAHDLVALFTIGFNKNLFAAFGAH